MGKWAVRGKEKKKESIVCSSMPKTPKYQPKKQRTHKRKHM
jgi:hypothetical protein